MAATTIPGAVGNTTFTFSGSTGLQNALAQQIIASATGLTANLITGTTGGTVTSSTTIDLGTGGILSGSASVPVSNVVLAGTGVTYVTGGSASSLVVAADNSQATIINTNPTGFLTAATGAGPNILVGFGAGDAFTTGNGGNDTVLMYGTTNTLTSNGSDAVLVGGPSTITAGANGVDSILLQQPTTLSFINGSKAGTVDSITGAAGSSVTLAGTGSTSVTSGAGPETFFVDTSAGNVTLNGNLQTTDTFEFVKDATTGTNATTVNSFQAGDNVFVHNYAGYNVTASASNAANSVLVLSDGSQVTFSNVSVATLQATVKVV